jgi:8-oxo-dGTP pyrophosphatase MutT (NUDIX family)
MEDLKYNGKIIQVTEEKIDSIVWERCYLPNGVIVFPFTKEGKILFVKEKRPHETPNVRLKPVSGILEDDKGSPAENANREMQEEIGFKAGSIKNFFTLKSNGTVNNTQYFFIASDLTASKLPNPDGEDTIMEIVELDIEELYHLYLSDAIRWSHSTLGFLRLYYGLKNGSITP